MIGRAIKQALKAGETTLSLTVLRDGNPVTLDLPLRRKSPFTTLDPATDPQAAALLADRIAFLERTQCNDGSWSGEYHSNHFLRTCVTLIRTWDRFTWVRRT